MAAAASHPAILGTIAATIVAVRFPAGLIRGPLEEEWAFVAQGGVVWHGAVDVLAAAALHLGIGYLAFLVTIGAVAAFLASDRLAEAIPNRGVRAAAALGLGLLPYREGFYATVLDAHWFLAIPLGLLLVARRSRRDPLIGGFIALNGLTAVLMAPAYVLRWRRHPALSAAVIAGAGVQVGALVTSGRAAGGAPPVEATVAAAVRLGVAPLGDVLWLPILGLLLVPAAIAAARTLPVGTVVVLAYLSIATALVGLPATSTPDRIWQPWAEERYFAAASWTMLLVGLSGHRTRSGALLLSAFAVAIALAFRVNGY